MNFYNEINPKACAWMQELISDAQIPPGEVACQSITDISHDLAKFTQCHFFAGIAGWPYALKLAGWPESRPVWTASLPCQSFSSAGQGRGFTDARGQLWHPFLALVRKYRPHCIFGEQVATAIRFGWLDRIFTDLEAEGYACGATVLCAAGVGAPHIRQRIFWVADSSEGGLQNRRTEGDGKNGNSGDEILRPTASEFCHHGGMAYPGHGPRRTQQRNELQECDSWFGESGAFDGVADTPHAARARQRQLTEHLSGQANFWADYELVACRDGKFRRTERGVKCCVGKVVARLPGRVVPSGNPGIAEANDTAEARVMRLFGYGNSIVAPLAAEFIKAAQERLAVVC